MLFRLKFSLSTATQDELSLLLAVINILVYIRMKHTTRQVSTIESEQQGSNTELVRSGTNMYFLTWHTQPLLQVRTNPKNCTILISKENRVMKAEEGGDGLESA